MKRRRTKILSLRAPRALVWEISREAKARKTTKSVELKRRLDFYSAAHQPPATSAEPTIPANQ